MSDPTPDSRVRAAVAGAPAPLPQRHDGHGLFAACSTFACRARAFVQRLNTVRVGGVGVVTALGSVAVVTVKPFASAFAEAHLGRIGAAALEPWLTTAYTGALATLPASIAAAYVGRPKGLTPPAP